MTLTTWAVDEHLSDAQVIRQSIGSLIGAAGGLVAAGGLALTQKGTPNMSVLVAGGTPAEGGCWLPGYTTSTGPYYFQNSASYEQVIETAGASNPRVDTIIARVYDTNLDSSGKHEPILAALKGAEESGCTLANKKGVAAVPKSSLVLGYVLVEAKASSIVTADIANVAALVGLPTGFVTTSALVAEAVTDAKIVKNRVLLETGNVYSALTEITASKAEEPSKTRPTFVSLLVVMHPETSSDMSVKVGGVKIAAFEVDAKAPAGIPQFSYSFICPPGVSWEWVNNGAEKVQASYLTV
jgi:hypothetical protein